MGASKYTDSFMAHHRVIINSGLLDKIKKDLYNHSFHKHFCELANHVVKKSKYHKGDMAHAYTMAGAGLAAVHRRLNSESKEKE